MTETKREDGGAAFGGSAFPNDGQWGNGHPEGGMSLRDYFAAAALTGLLAADARYGGRTDARDLLAADAYKFADAMIAERRKP